MFSPHSFVHGQNCPLQSLKSPQNYIDWHLLASPSTSVLEQTGLFVCLFVSPAWDANVGLHLRGHKFVKILIFISIILLEWHSVCKVWSLQSSVLVLTSGYRARRVKPQAALQPDCMPNQNQSWSLSSNLCPVTWLWSTALADSGVEVMDASLCHVLPLWVLFPTYVLESKIRPWRTHVLDSAS